MDGAHGLPMYPLGFNGDGTAQYCQFPPSTLEMIRQDYYPRHPPLDTSSQSPQGYPTEPVPTPLLTHTEPRPNSALGYTDENPLAGYHSSYGFSQVQLPIPNSTIMSPTSVIASPFCSNGDTRGSNSLSGALNGERSCDELLLASAQFLPAGPSNHPLQSPLDGQSEENAFSETIREEAPDDVSHSANAEVAEPKRRPHRRIWTHALEKLLFSQYEIATLGAPHRRTIYVASLEAHIDRLHSQLLGLGLYPITVEALQQYKGLNCKTAKGMVAGVQHDIASVRGQVLEFEQAINNAEHTASLRKHQALLGARKFSLDSSFPAAHP